MPAGLKKKLKIKSDLQDKERNLTGETVNWGGSRRDVYEEKVPQSKLERVVDPDTNRAMLKRGPNGNPLSGTFHTNRVPITDLDDPELPALPAQGQRFEKVNGQVHLVREYILVDQGNGMVHKNYHFRPDPEAAKRAAREKRRQDRLDALLDRLDAEDADEVMGALSGPDDGDEDYEGDVGEDTDYPVHKGFGAYELSDGTVLPRGTGKDAAIEAESRLTD